VKLPVAVPVVRLGKWRRHADRLNSSFLKEPGPRFVCSRILQPELFSGIACLKFTGAQNSAPSGTYEGILIFQDRTLGTSGGNGDVIQGNQTGSHLDGVIYVPKGLITYTGNMDGTGYQSIVADTITFTGNSTMSSDYQQFGRHRL